MVATDLTIAAWKWGGLIVHLTDSNNFNCTSLRASVPFEVCHPKREAPNQLKLNKHPQTKDQDGLWEETLAGILY